jgi:hypothetical protein
MNLRIYLLIAIFTFFQKYLYSQAVNNGYIDKGDFTSVTPEVATFPKYGNIPINFYTGGPDINIPLYSISEGDINLPITLRYLSNHGLKVNEEATWVGLGWDLDVGGAIALAIIGGLDRPQVYNTTASEWARFYAIPPNLLYPELQSTNIDNFTRHEFGDCSWSPTSNCGNDSDPWNTLIQVENGIMGEQDYFIAHFNGNLIKFFKNPITGEITEIDNKSNFIISFNNNKWEIKTTEGLTYFFESAETTFLDNSTGFNGGGMTYTKWNLSKILDLSGNSISFVYQNFGYLYPLPQQSSYYAHYPPAEDPEGHIRTREHQDLDSWYINYVSVQYLKEIISTNTIIKFNVSTRQDLAGNGARKLDNIEIIDKKNNLTKKKFVFEYGYFEGSQVGGDYIQYYASIWGGNALPQFNSDSKSKRLKLLSLKETSGINEIPPYRFSYDETINLPSKASSSYDYWGYFNNQSTINSLLRPGLASIIPDIKDYISIHPNIIPIEITKRYNGANRKFDPLACKAGILKEIQYPTGGKTVFDFESNRFDNFKIIYNGQTDGISEYIFEPKDQNNPSITGPTNIEFVVSNDCLANLYSEINGGLEWNRQWLGTMAGSSIKLEKKIGTAYQIIKENTLTSNDPDFNITFLKTWDEDLYLSAGEYKLTANLQDNIDLHGQLSGGAIVKAKISYKIYNYFESLGAGLRIKSVTNYDENGTVASKKEYYYQGDNGKTSGKLMSDINFSLSKNYIEKTVWVGQPDLDKPCYGCVFVTGQNLLTTFVYSNNINPISYSANGNYVGYSKDSVKEIGVQNNGYNELYFENFPDYYNVNTPGCPGIKHPGNGNLLKEKFYNAQNKLVKFDSLEYSLLEKNAYYVNAKIDNYYIGPRDQTDYIFCNGPDDCTESPFINVFKYGSPFQVPYVYNIYFYPFTYYWIENTKKTERVFDLNGLNKIENIASYSYNKTNHLISNVITYRSDGSTVEDKYLYSCDYSLQTDGFINDLKNSNLINIPIEEYSLLNSKVIEGTINTFKIGIDKGLLDKRYELETKVPLSISASNSTGFFQIDVNYKPKFNFDFYDSKGNLTQSHKEGDINTAYFYSYDGAFLSIKAINTTSAELSSAVSNSNINIDEITTPSLNQTQMNNLKNLNDYLRVTALPNAMIWTYTYDPLVGITSETDERGYTKYYEYDFFGRLQYIKDKDNQIIYEYKLHYKE